MSSVDELKFLFTTMKGVHLFNKGDVSTILERTKHTICYFGITWDEHNFYFGENYNQKEDSRVIVIDRSTLEKKDTINIEGFTDVHQILYNDGKLYLCNTGKNSIIIYGLNENKVLRRINIGKIRKDVNHVNGIWIKNNVLYATFLNKTLGYKSFVKSYDLQSLNELNEIHIGDGIHNIYINDKNEWFTCSSHSKQFMKKFNGKVITHDFSSDNWFWLRGLAAFDNKFLIGGSQIKNNNQRKFIKKNKFYIFNTDLDLVNSREINIDRSGPIYDIRLLDPFDRSHNGVV